jgi:hypothetical protein
MADTEHRASRVPGVYGLLADGTTVLIRPVTSHDVDEVLRLYEEMSPESVRARFFAAGASLGRRAAGGGARVRW